MEGTMVACLSCNQIVWAYDANMGDVRGILNMMKMPCRLCGNATGNYDSWRINEELAEYYGISIYDGWGVMRRLAKENGFAWNISGTNEWFTESSLASETLRQRDLLLEALQELIEVGDLRGDTQLPYPSDDPILWTARMQEAWDVARDVIATATEPAATEVL